jgi:ribosome-binding protein aMBF1 (putative translation factor)
MEPQRVYSDHENDPGPQSKKPRIRKAQIDAAGVQYLQARLGRAIRHRRRTMDLTLQDLAASCGVSFQQIHKYESGHCSLSASQLWAIAQVLEVPVSYFYESLRPSEVWRNPDAGMA